MGCMDYPSTHPLSHYAGLKIVVPTFKMFAFVFSGDRQICGNGVVEGSEQCDCGHDDAATCDYQDPCCTINCTLKITSQCTLVFYTTVCHTIR